MSGPGEPTWEEDGRPLYQQLRDRVVADILDGSLAAHASVPSVRQTASRFNINPLTVAKAYHLLEDEGWIERHRGGSYTVVEQAQMDLLRSERTHFLTEEWPLLQTRLARLGWRVRLEELPLSAAHPLLDEPPKDA